MKTLLSPAKTLDFNSEQKIGSGVEPFFPEASQKVGNKMAKLSVPKLIALQKISKDLAKVNRQRNLDWTIESNAQARQAVLAFKGDVYLGLEAWNWTETDMDFAREALWILSGWYGILRPDTLIQPYRLEMGTTLPIGRKPNLYAFWEPVLKDFFAQNLAEEETIVNLASKEYAHVVKQLELKNPMIDVDFLDYSKGEYKVLSFFAKKARGLMANFIVQHRISDWRDLKDFNLAGYYFDASRSEPQKLVFLRDQK
ncbi:peroxide stress protein YaaA [Croceimicrobium sp.]|uniref:peroxide stress protein YaaA n=1 Tax=Croceimicrobium sp. TaxID=2828340 RepID=UPI003BABEE98